MSQFEFWIIVHYIDCKTINVMLESDGEPMIFDSKELGERYAQNNCAWYWVVVEL